MNYLAHAYLSFGNDEILLGNMISDFVKGKKQFLYPPVVHKGILLHRAIDDFTDTHPVTQKAKSVFKTAYRLYSGAFIDVVYDHFLAIEQTAFADEGALFDFSQTTYKQLEKQMAVMPSAFERMFFYMQSQNWLYGYRTLPGIYQSFGGLVRRAAYLQDSTPAIRIFDQHYSFLQSCFNEFWEDIRFFAFNKMNLLLSDNRTLPE
ncbi:ACP phosphodiesterase [Niabella sp. CJ426]|uniref:acyl carrier protein phosphodiesterase n=1 Tax=Niabella sp. CJ426 TaxID=3393740 RepID=UPI003D0901F3